MLRFIRKFFTKEPDPFAPSKVTHRGHDVLMTDTTIDLNDPEHGNVFWPNK